MKSSARYSGNFEFITFLGEFEKGVLVGNIVFIRNECLFPGFIGGCIGVRNKQIVREPLCDSRDMFFPRSDSFPMSPEKLLA